ncbi:GDSL esterase/lipase [Acorus calamus]|uniref:GDSL esterase/lipase n=1 Tax=Acorus calamus TaxID=4465 RepID=A0AAV9DX34_ACOCL|nr:GDSL esterase/lipase [Acorus calamus]
MASLVPVWVALVLVFSLNVSPSLSIASFVFGDSLVDAGNNDYLFTLSKADSPPYGIDFAASGGRPTGRFTNGRTISDIIGQAMGEKGFPPPFLAPTTSGDTLFGGVNYASGASGILDETGSLFIGRVPLSTQISYFEQSRAYMVGMVGQNATDEFLKGSVFSITTGSNDILNYMEPSIPFLGQEKVSHTMFQDYMISNLTLHLKRLNELGARRFVVVGVGPLGCIPYVRALKLLPDETCSSVANRLTQGYNMKLRRMLDQLNDKMGPSSMFVYANSYDIFMGIIQHYQHYGDDTTIT